MHPTNDHDHPAAGRDANGRFAKGNKGGPGNPFARKVAELRRALVNFVTEDDMKHIAFVLKEKAMGGDLAAIKLLFQYVLGKPQPTPDPDRLDVDEWQKMKEQARPVEEMGQVVHSVPAEFATTMTRIAWPCAMAENVVKPMQEELRQMDARDARRAARAARRAARKANGSNGTKPAAAEEPPKANGSNGEPSPVARMARMIQELVLSGDLRREEILDCFRPSTNVPNGY
jgi:hypothetical protein